MDADPTAGIVITLPKSDGHDTWDEEQIAQFEKRWPIGTRERLLFALLLHTGQRCSDVRLLGPTSIVKGAFPIKQKKTGAKVCIPVHPELAAAIKACNVMNISGFFLTTSTGKPLDQRELNKWFRRACREAGLPDTCVPHGLRKAMCVRLAQKGASAHLIKAVSGHKTLKEVTRYTDAFDNAQGARAAFALLTGAGEAAE
jgi:integrase